MKHFVSGSVALFTHNLQETRSLLLENKLMFIQFTDNHLFVFERWGGWGGEKNLRCWLRTNSMFFGAQKKKRWVFEKPINVKTESLKLLNLKTQTKTHFRKKVPRFTSRFHQPKSLKTQGENIHFDVPFCIRYGRQLACVGVILNRFVSFCIRYGRQLALCHLHQVWSSVGVGLSHFASDTVVSWPVCAILHEVWSSVGVGLSHFASDTACLCHFAPGMVVSWCKPVPRWIRYGRQLACLCHFASAMVVSLRVCAILDQVWSSVGVGLCHFASGTVVSWRVFVPFCIRYIRYGRQLACSCHFASGMVVSWRVCAILHQLWSSVCVFVPFCIRYGRQLACFCGILHQVRLSVGMFVPFCIRYIRYGRQLLWEFCISHGRQLACLCHFA